MKDKMTIKEASLLWGLSERRIRGLCTEGKITGAIKDGRSWLLPKNSKKPTDKRIKNGKYIKESSERLPLPIGISDYSLAVSQYYYVDKTMMIKDILDDKPMVSLFTRPRRFGKTLNMDMLKTFFEKSDEDTSIYFKDKDIWKCDDKYKEYQGKYPVIFITLKDVKKDTWDKTYKSIAQIISLEYKRHKELNDKKNSDLDYYLKVVEGKIDKEIFDSSLYMLSKMLDEYYGIAPIIIIDEYDVPIQQGYINNFYNETIQFMRNLFSGCFKDNKHLSFGFLTGILRVAKESIFSGLNNVIINSVLDNKYSSYFGFTKQDIDKMLVYYDIKDKEKEICDWYDGYKFGNQDIYNPWSVINYISNECEPKAYWLSTGSNDIISEILKNPDKELCEKLTSLVNKEKIITYIDTGVIYPQIKNNSSSIFSFLLVTGYLKVIKVYPASNGDYICEVGLPNKEVSFVYNKEILEKMNSIIPQTTFISIQEALFTKNVNKLKDLINTFLEQSVSYFDIEKENFYHGFILGMCVLFNDYYATSNKESGDGRYDIELKPKDSSLPGVIIEIKVEDNKNNLNKKALDALKQINDKKYDTQLRKEGIKTVYKYGVAFYKKNVEIVFDE